MKKARLPPTRYGVLANLNSQYNEDRIDLQYGSRYRLRLVNGGVSWNLKVLTLS